MSDDVDALARDVVSGDRRALARAITLVESTRDDDRVNADRLLELLLPKTGKALRVGISGTPGVGKTRFASDLAEALETPIRRHSMENAQAGAVLALNLLANPGEQPLVFFMGIDKVKFRKPVVPGDQLRLEVTPLRKGAAIWKLAGKALVGDQVVTEAEFLATISKK